MDKEETQQLEVELICQSNGLNGIGRYTRELHKHLTPHVSVRKVEPIYPPLTNRIDPLRYFPIGVHPHRRGSIVHFTEDFGCSQMFWNPLRPAVATSHDLGFLAWPPEASMHRSFDRILLYLSYLGLKRMDAVITVSEYSRKRIIQQLKIPTERVFVIYSGNDGNHFKPITNARAKLAEQYGFSEDSQSKILLYTGAEFPRKNLLTILRMLRRLPSNVRLLKAGEPGGERFRVNTKKIIAELQLEDRVFFLDTVPDKDLPFIYSAADTYVCASFIEGFGFPILEAMACGTPVVCSNATSLPEIAGEAAILVPPDDVQGFAEAVYTVLRDEAVRADMITRGLNQASFFSWKQTASRVAEVYHLVAKSTPI